MCLYFIFPLCFFHLTGARQSTDYCLLCFLLVVLVFGLSEQYTLQYYFTLGFRLDRVLTQPLFVSVTAACGSPQPCV